MRGRSLVLIFLWDSKVSERDFGLFVEYSVDVARGSFPSEWIILLVKGLSCSRGP